MLLHIVRCMLHHTALWQAGVDTSKSLQTFAAETSFRGGKTELGKGSGIKKAKKKALFKAFLKPATVLRLCWGAGSLWVLSQHGWSWHISGTV